MDFGQFVEIMLLQEHVPHTLDPWRRYSGCTDTEFSQIFKTAVCQYEVCTIGIWNRTCFYTVYLVISLVPAVFMYCAKPLGAPEDEFKLDYLSFDYWFGISYGIFCLLKTKMFPGSHRPAKNLFPFSFIFFSFSGFFSQPTHLSE